jgi:hypothetical protein
MLFGITRSIDLGDETNFHEIFRYNVQKSTTVAGRGVGERLICKGRSYFDVL